MIVAGALPVSGQVRGSESKPGAPEIISFGADDRYIQPGESATLSWKTKGADTVVITPDPGAKCGADGKTSLKPAATTTYTLTATNNSGSATATVRIGVGPSRPNIVFFLVDDMGWEDTSVPFLYKNGKPVVTEHNRRYRTPNMQKLADSGMKFTNAYAMPVCTPSRVCWITGLNSARHHVTNWTSLNGADTDENSAPSHNSSEHWEKTGLPANLVTLPSLLQAAGYKTIHAGKAHFGSTAYARNPLNLGFDVNIAGSEAGHPGSYTGNYGKGGPRAVPGLDAYHDTGTFLTEALTLEMNKAIETAVDEGAPFFAYMSHYAVHAPFEADPRFAANYPDLPKPQRNYATMIEGMDKSLGDIVAKLKELGVAKDTLIVFMSDNGGDSPFPDVNKSNAPLRHKKGSKYEGGVREPMIVSWAKPDAADPFQKSLPIPAGSRQDDIVAIFDFFPTFAGVAGVKTPPDLDGHDLTPYFRGEPGSHRPQELLIHFPHDHRSAYFTILRQGDWKLIYNYVSDSYELYNLASDISEANDLAADEPERVMNMAREMGRQLAKENAQWPTFAGSGKDDQLELPAPAVKASGR